MTEYVVNEHASQHGQLPRPRNRAHVFVHVRDGVPELLLERCVPERRRRLPGREE